MAARKVVISGLGLIAPMAATPEAFWAALRDGTSGIRAVLLPGAGESTFLAGEVSDRSYEHSVPPRLLRNGTRVSRFAVAAGIGALTHAGLNSAAGASGELAVLLGTALGGWREGEQQHAVLLERGSRRVNPFVANAAPNHGAAAELACHLGATGPQFTYSSGCPSSLQALAHGAMLIRSGEIDVCLAGGAESPFSPLVIAGMGRTMELAKETDDPTRASRPFDRRHTGMVLSEGACMLVLESDERARARGATIYAEVVGGASSCDAQGLFQVDGGGAVGGQTIQKLLARHGLTAGDIQWVCAHANSSPAFDRKETKVLKHAFGATAPRIPASSIKAVLGHPFGASGAFQTAAACLALRQQIIPPTHFLDEPDFECDLDYVPNVARPALLEHVLVTSYGYGGVNGYLLLRRA